MAEKKTEASELEKTLNAFFTEKIDPKFSEFEDRFQSMKKKPKDGDPERLTKEQFNNGLDEIKALFDGLAESIKGMFVEPEPEPEPGKKKKAKRSAFMSFLIGDDDE